MAKMKTIGIEAKLDDKFKIEVKAGDHIMYVDQTKAGGGTDAGATPLEYLFASLAGCIGTVARIVANQKRIKLNGMDIKVEGAFDLETLLGKSKETEPGLLRSLILSRGNVGDYAQLYREFRGKDPSIEWMLKRRGIATQ